MDDDSSNPGLEITSDIVIKSDDTYSFKVVMTDNSGFGIISEDHCRRVPGWRAARRVRTERAPQEPSRRTGA